MFKLNLFFVLFSSDSLDERDGGINNVFYFAGSAFLLAGLIAVVVINVKRCFRYVTL